MSGNTTVTSATDALKPYVAWVTIRRDAPPVRRDFIADDPLSGLKALLAEMPRGSSATCRPLHREGPDLRLHAIDVAYVTHAGAKVELQVHARSTFEALDDLVDQHGDEIAKMTAKMSAGACTSELHHG